MNRFITSALPWILIILGVLFFARGCMGSDIMQYAGAFFIFAGIVGFDMKIQVKKNKEIVE